MRVFSGERGHYELALARAQLPYGVTGLSGAKLAELRNTYVKTMELAVAREAVMNIHETFAARVEAYLDYLRRVGFALKIEGEPPAYPVGRRL